MKCVECGNPMATSDGSHSFVYDQGPGITLREVTHRACTCGRHEVEIPKIGSLIEEIGQALRLRIRRDHLTFFFAPGKHGVQDGTWGVSIRQPPAVERPRRARRQGRRS